MYAETLRERPEEASLVALTILGLVGAWYHALTTEFTGDPIVDPVGMLASSPLTAAWLTVAAVWLAWMMYLDRKGADQ